MKLITWNCQGAFRKKAHLMLELKPDILVVQECEHPDRLIFNEKILLPNSYLWFGDYEHKGLGVFSYCNCKLELSDQHNSDIKVILPIYVKGDLNNFTLFAIWACKSEDKDNQYIGQVWKAIHYYDQIINTSQTILIGDFNSNKIWDRKHRQGNHSDVVDRLIEKNIYSVYHKCFDEEQGIESNPTFFLQRKENKPYHIDYCFCSADINDRIQNIRIGKYDDWIPHSDHMPMIIEIDIK